MKTNLVIPDRFVTILKNDPKLYGAVLDVLSDFGEILKENQLYFFEEYTDHGISHIQQVLYAADDIIPDNCFATLTSKDIAILCLAIFLHDIGMHTSLSTFNNMIDGEYDHIMIKELDEKTWKQLWEEYTDEAKKFSGKQLNKIFGNEHYEVKIPDLKNKGELTENSKKLVGEFIRRYHPRIAHEVAIRGILGHNNTVIKFAQTLSNDYKDLAGLIGRSHGMEIRECFNYLTKFSQEEWAMPYSIHVVYIMVILRVADYFQFDTERSSNVTLKLKTFSSPVSEIEHLNHNAIKFVKPFHKDSETLMVECTPPTSYIFLKLKDLFKSIQYELDISWAVLGEIYGKEESNRRLSMKYRRIKSNLDSINIFSRSVNYIPDQLSFTSDEELPKLLIGPLYGNDPTFGIRELIQNAVDACKERVKDEQKKSNDSYRPIIHLSIEEVNEVYSFQIKDNGRGMTLFELKNYFLKAGASFRKSLEWQKRYTDNDGKSIVERSGRFGVGVLAAFLIGDEIEVITQSTHEKTGYHFLAKMDSEQLEIKKINTNEIGTIIKIVISKSVYDYLSGDNNFNDHIYGDKEKINWTKWYTLQTPTIIYNTSQYKNFTAYTNPDPSFTDKEPVDWNSFEALGFEKVLWTYSSKYTPPKLTCNGIIIPEAYHLNQQGAYNNFSSDFYKEIRINEPKVSVFDSNANLNLNLNRNSLLDSKLPFQDQLIVEVYKDLLAYILTYSPKVIYQHNQLTQEYDLIKHPSVYTNQSYRKYGEDSYLNLCYTKDGFSINNDYCITQISKYHRYPSLHQLYFFEKNEINIPIKLPNSFEILCLDYKFSDTIGELSQVLDPLYGRGLVVTSLEYYDKMFNSRVKRIRKGLIDHHIVNERDEENIIYRIAYESPKDFSLVDFNNLNRINAIVETDIYTNYPYHFNKDYYPNGYNNGIFNQLLELYLKDDPIIPYDLNQRKQKFPFAFEKLDTYIKKYT